MSGEPFSDGELWDDGKGWIEMAASEPEEIAVVVAEVKDVLAAVGIEWSQIMWIAPDGSIWIDDKKVHGDG